MSALTSALRAVRDATDVLFIQRARGGASGRAVSHRVAEVVREARFHAHARLPELDLVDVIGLIGSGAVDEITLPGPTDLIGNATASYYPTLAILTRAIAPARILEFGTYGGVGTLTMARNARSARVVTVDLPDTSEAAGPAEETTSWASGRVGAAFLGTDAADRITMVRTNSLTWRPEADLGTFDLVLIDGGHTAEIVGADTANARALLAPDGVIIWDDYIDSFPGVVTVLDRLADEGLPLARVRGSNVVLHSTRLAP